jgi:hypothetical protein
VHEHADVITMCAPLSAVRCFKWTALMDCALVENQNRPWRKSPSAAEHRGSPFAVTVATIRWRTPTS